MLISIAQINPTIGDLSGNATLILNGIKEGKKAGASVVLFPELCLSGYPPEDFLLVPHFIDAVEKALMAIATHTHGIAAVIGTVRRNLVSGEKALFNSAAVIENGAILGYQDKVLLPTYDVFDERRFFEPGRQMNLWTLAKQKVAITICEDIWQFSSTLKETHYQRDPIVELSLLRPACALNLSASPFCAQKVSLRLHAAAQAAKALECPLALCNQVGGNDSLIFDGHSFLMDRKGHLVALAEGFKSDMLLVDTAKAGSGLTYHDPGISDVYEALVLGLKDYFVKSGFKKACLGISGGIDSAVVACLAVAALGRENVLGVLMPSCYTENESLEDAYALAHSLGIETKKISIEHPREAFLETLTPHFEGLPSDATEENIQARIRGIYLMALSNKLGYIVLSTGNKSELAMGYSTLYGDMCGGLAVISDVTKQQVYALARYINRQQEVIPHHTIVRAPTAELRPNQKDTDSLPEYAIVDAVLQDYIEEHASAEAIAKNHALPLPLVRDLIKRIHTNEYKRRQSPPGLRVTEKAFTIGRRFPIVQKFV